MSVLIEAQQWFIGNQGLVVLVVFAAAFAATVEGVWSFGRSMQ